MKTIKTTAVETVNVAKNTNTVMTTRICQVCGEPMSFICGGWYCEEYYNHRYPLTIKEN